MPHIIIEHSANVADLTDMDALVDAVHRAALDDGLPALDALRTRAAPRHHYRIADGDPAYGFVYVTARIGPGREPEAVQRFLNRLIDTVDEALAPLQARPPRGDQRRSPVDRPDHAHQPQPHPHPRHPTRPHLERGTHPQIICAAWPAR